MIRTCLSMIEIVTHRVLERDPTEHSGESISMFRVGSCSCRTLRVFSGEQSEGPTTHSRVESSEVGRRKNAASFIQLFPSSKP